ncbi:MAG: hypothetical protein ACK5TK_18555 [Betaproteobacteria bacterium]
MNATDIVTTFTAERLAGRRAAIAQLLATGIAALQRAQAVASESALACAEFALILRGEQTLCWQVTGPAPAGRDELLAAALQPVDAAGWRHVLAASGVQPFMHSAECLAYFSDRGRLFQSDRGRCFSVIVDGISG